MSARSVRMDDIKSCLYQDKCRRNAGPPPLAE
jgi:hypothetical protein